jgi:hypothetical protein
MTSGFSWVAPEDFKSGFLPIITLLWPTGRFLRYWLAGFAQPQSIRTHDAEQAAEAIATLTSQESEGPV